MKYKNMTTNFLKGLAALGFISQMSHATLPAEDLMQHETMPSKTQADIVTISDVQMPFTKEGRVHFVNSNSGKYLGALNTGYWYGGVVLPKTRNEIISPETYFERGDRGKRTDIVAFYDPETLRNTGEVILPSKRMTPVKAQGASALSENEKFLAVMNVTPATSISIVNLDTREFVTEIETPGCTYVYPNGPQRFNLICADGSFMNIELDDNGELAKRSRRPASFDPRKDPLTNDVVRTDNGWYQLSMDGDLYQFTNRADGSLSAESWSLLTAEDREDNWRIGGHQRMAIHQKSQKLYVLMIQGGAEMFEDPTDQVWVFDLTTQQRVATLELDKPAMWMSVSQGTNPKLYAVSIDMQMPFLFAAWIYFTEGYDHILRMSTFSFDIYDAKTAELKHSLPQIGKFPNYIQEWN